MEKNQSVRDGITLSGGDPMYPGNRKAILSLCKAFRHRFGDTKTIWMYTGYKLEEIQDDPILQYIDVLVDDVFVEELADVSYPWAGSTNQTVWQRQGKEWVRYHDV
jgi:anaerobic ribonucleoside-triphosphate reductase activating protein